MSDENLYKIGDVNTQALQPDADVRINHYAVIDALHSQLASGITSEKSFRRCLTSFDLSKLSESSKANIHRFLVNKCRIDSDLAKLWISSAEI